MPQLHWLKQPRMFARVAGRAATALLCAGVAMLSQDARGAATSNAIPNFAPDPDTSWIPDRPAGDEFMPPPSGPGPVQSPPDHPYIPNGQGRQTYRIADVTNPILMPWVADRLKQHNDDVRLGKVPFNAKERCWPPGVPAFQVFRRVELVYFVQTPKEVLIIHEGDNQVRHVYMNVPHSADPKPSWYGESVGRYEGDELVVDTIGQNDRTLIDNYGTPHTDKLHVVERFKMIDGGKTLQVLINVDDQGAFTMPWSAIQRFKRVEDRGALIEEPCAENNVSYFGYDVIPIPEAEKPDF
jgi:hypothetical protein